MIYEIRQNAKCIVALHRYDNDYIHLAKLVTYLKNPSTVLGRIFPSGFKCSSSQYKYKCERFSLWFCIRGTIEKPDADRSYSCHLSVLMEEYFILQRIQEHLHCVFTSNSAEE